MPANVLEFIQTNISAISAFVDLVTVLILIWTAFEVRKATYANTYKVVIDLVQADEIRSARDVVMLALKDKPFDQWTEFEIKEARKVCQAYDAVGQILKNGYLPTRIVADSWGPSLRVSWHILAPLVRQMRHKANAFEYWNDYEWLVKQTPKYHQPVYSERHSPNSREE